VEAWPCLSLDHAPADLPGRSWSWRPTLTTNPGHTTWSRGTPPCRRARAGAPPTPCSCASCSRGAAPGTQTPSRCLSGAGPCRQGCSAIAVSVLQILTNKGRCAVVALLLPHSRTLQHPPTPVTARGQGAGCAALPVAVRAGHLPVHHRRPAHRVRPAAPRLRSRPASRPAHKAQLAPCGPLSLAGGGDGGD